jgi:hypothetical protein
MVNAGIHPKFIGIVQVVVAPPHPSYYLLVLIVLVPQSVCLVCIFYVEIPSYEYCCMWNLSNSN